MKRRSRQKVHAVERSPCPAGASFSTPTELEGILEQGFAASSKPLTEARKCRIAEQAGL
jgi:hypothetical protein